MDTLHPFFFFTILSSDLEKGSELHEGVKETADKGSGDMVNRGIALRGLQRSL